MACLVNRLPRHSTRKHRHQLPRRHDGPRLFIARDRIPKAAIVIEHVRRPYVKLDRLEQKPLMPLIVDGWQLFATAVSIFGIARNPVPNETIARRVKRNSATARSRAPSDAPCVAAIGDIFPDILRIRLPPLQLLDGHRLEFAGELRSSEGHLLAIVSLFNFTPAELVLLKRL